MKKQIITGFTIAELIVVITILSILSSVAYVSYQGYSSNARDSKRKSDVTNLITKIELLKTQGEDIFGFVENNNSTIQDNIQISGYTGTTTLGSNYISGDPNFVNLELTGESFSDPLTGDLYQVGVTSFGNRYEVATSLEQNNAYSIYTAGTWEPRTSLEARAARDKIVGNIFYMSGSTKNDILLSTGDKVRVGSGSTETYIIKRIKLDRIILDRNIVNTGENIFLNNDETRHLIKRWDSDWAIEENKGNIYLPYSLK